MGWLDWSGNLFLAWERFELGLIGLFDEIWDCFLPMPGANKESLSTYLSFWVLRYLLVVASKIRTFIPGDGEAFFGADFGCVKDCFFLEKDTVFHSSPFVVWVIDCISACTVFLYVESGFE